MQKRDIAKKMAQRTGLTQAKASHAINVLLNIIMDELAGGEDISLRGFGTFKVTNRGRKTARDIRNGLMIAIPPHKAVKFVPSHELKQLVR